MTRRHRGQLLFWLLFLILGSVIWVVSDRLVPISPWPRAWTQPRPEVPWCGPRVETCPWAVLQRVSEQRAKLGWWGCATL